MRNPDGAKGVRVVWLLVLLLVTDPRPVTAAGAEPATAGLAPVLEAVEDTVARALVQLDALEDPGPSPSPPPPPEAGPVVPVSGGPDLSLAAPRRLVRTLDRRLADLTTHPAVAGDPRRRAVVAVMREDLRRLVLLLPGAGTIPRTELATAPRGLLVDLDGAAAALWTLE